MNLIGIFSIKINNQIVYINNDSKELNKKNIISKKDIKKISHQ